MHNAFQLTEIHTLHTYFTTTLRLHLHLVALFRILWKISMSPPPFTPKAKATKELADYDHKYDMLKRAYEEKKVHLGLGYIDDLHNEYFSSPYRPH